MHIENARSAQLADVIDIYAHHVTHGFATFDERPPTLAERRPWFDQFAATGLHQLLVAVEDGKVLGYAASLPYRTHPAFARTVELTIYLAESSAGRGVGTALYGELLDRVRTAGALTVVAGVALPNPASVALHTRFGFREVGVFEDYAEKRGRRMSSAWFQLML